MLRKLFNYIADSMAWELDLEKTSDRAAGGFMGDNVDRNLYYINLRTGDRKITVTRFSHTPPDYNWLAKTENKGIVDDALFGIKIYTIDELQTLAAKRNDHNNQQPRP